MNSRILTWMGATALFPSLCSAAAITWGAATDTAGISDLVSGTYIYALNGGFGADPLPTGFSNVNFTSLPAGVTVVPVTGGTTFQDRTLDDVGTDFTLGTGDTGFDNLINSVTDSKGTDGGGITEATMIFASLVNGQNYNIQVFFNEQRNGGDNHTRAMIYGDGLGNSVTLAGNNGMEGLLGGEGEYGQHAVGTFIASGTTQELTMLTNGFGNIHFNAILITAIPEPSTSALFAGALLATVFVRRRQQVA